MNDVTPIPTESPFLIVGVGSSGSTLLSVILDRHPLIACGPELSVFNKLRIYGDFKKFRRMLPLWLERGLSTDGLAEYREFFFNSDAYFWTKTELFSLAKDSTDHRDFFDRFFTHYLEKRKKFIWGEKTGTNAYCIPEFLNLYPQARIIHITRDGRDMVCSMMGRPGNTAYHCVSHWLYDVSAAIAFRNEPGYLEVRYEDLVMNPMSQLERICDHIGVEFERKMMLPNPDVYWKRFSKGNVHDSWTENPLSGKISTGSIGRYRKELTEDIEILFWQTRLTALGKKRLKVKHHSTIDLMKTLGYLKQEPSIDNRVSLKHYQTAINEIWSRLKREFILEHRLILPLLWIWIKPR